MIDEFTAKYALELLDGAKSAKEGEWWDSFYTTIGMVDCYRDSFENRPTLAVHPNSSIKKRTLRWMFGKYAGAPEDGNIFYDANENLLFLTSKEGIDSFVGSLERLKVRPLVIRSEKYPMQSMYR